ncbi:thiamine pyrophosphokinase [Algoriphagus aestuariicola]|uniref:Thiamine pyrophosphokinase n=1 Tax=Algoriphagus aestuariicola TaxID=1852016 RepID=A0ABS3BRU2_9BACT|nr:thiamine pyrophosphokinase [Algoriphagus aestuariicola]MBN7802018.1 thiamine pyrophosphokinase [Algoriphagus aestuariicola]
MSSHHFVKEQQEPAVFILSTGGLGFDAVSPLLEWVPTVIVWQECLDTVLSWGIKVDVILAEEAFQKENIHLLEEQYPVRFLTANADNFLHEGLQYLLASQHKGAHLVGFDHSKLETLTPEAELLDLTVLDDGWKYYPVKTREFKKWFVASTIRILGREGMPLEVANSDGKLFLPLFYLTQLEVPEGITEIKGADLFWVGEEV